MTLTLCQLWVEACAGTWLVLPLAGVQGELLLLFQHMTYIKPSEGDFLLKDVFPLWTVSP